MNAQSSYAKLSYLFTSECSPFFALSIIGGVMKLGKLFLLGLGMALLLPGKAHAYIDPGSGALVWQMLVAAFFGLLFYVGKTRNWIIEWIRKMIGCIKKDDRKSHE
jgi:hypothetical protein